MNNHFVKLPSNRGQCIRIILLIAMAHIVWAIPTQAAITNFQSNAWDSDIPHIYRNGQPVISSGQASEEVLLDGVPYFSTEEIYEDLAIAFNGAAAGNPDTQNKEIHLHLVAYTAPGYAEPFYYLENSTGHTITYRISTDDLLEMGYRPRKSIWVQSNVILDGSLALARGSREDDFSDLTASLDILVSRIYPDKLIAKGPKAGQPREKILFKGSIQLTGTRKGAPAVKSTGKIKKQLITDYRDKLGTDNENLERYFEIAFDEVYIPYRTKITLDNEFTIKTQVSGFVTTKADGSGAEVFFGAGEDSLKLYLESLLPDETQHIDLDNLDWSVPILIDQSETVFGDPQIRRPRDNRGLAISPDGAYLYAGYNNSLYPNGEVRCIDPNLSGNVEPFISRITNVRGKAIAVDDLGRVYLAEGTTIEVYDHGLANHLFTISDLVNVEGVAVTRQDNQLVLYSSDRTFGTLEKRILTEDDVYISNAELDVSFGVNGVVTLAQNLRGVEIDEQGRVWVAGFGNDTVYRISPDGVIVDSIEVSHPIDIGFDGDVMLVTRYTDRVISRFDADSLESLGPDITVPWEDLGLDSNEPDGDGALSGIVVIPGVGFFLANEGGQTLPFEEPPGSGNFVDDNDPILFAISPEEPDDGEPDIP